MLSVYWPELFLVVMRWGGKRSWHIHSFRSLSQSSSQQLLLSLELQRSRKQPFGDCWNTTVFVISAHCPLHFLIKMYLSLAINCSPSWPTMTPPLLASSSVVAKPLSIFWRATGGGVGGREEGGVGGLLKLFCCREIKNTSDHLYVSYMKSNKWSLLLMSRDLM